MSLTQPESAAQVDAAIAAVIADPGVRYWVKDALQHAARRDPLDALADAELIADLLRRRFDAVAGTALASVRSGSPPLN